MSKSVTIVGMPASGKTTYLAALWAVLSERNNNTVLRFRSLSSGDRAYLNSISARWLEAKEQTRNEVIGNRSVTLNLKDTGGNDFSIDFPDVAGEDFRAIWEARHCNKDIFENIEKGGGIIIFIHADRINAMQHVTETAALSQAIGDDTPSEGPVVDWSPRMAPTQVQLVSLLDSLSSPPFTGFPRRAAIMLSAWDKVEEEDLLPSKFLNRNLPMLGQFVRQNIPSWEWRVYGISAQGGEYDSVDDPERQMADAKRLRELSAPSERVRLVTDEGETKDITEPLAWVLG